MSLFLIIGIVAALWVYRDAQRFGYARNLALLWAFATMMAAWIALPLYLLFGRKVQPHREKRLEQTTIKADADFADAPAQACPMCAAKVKPEFKVCPYCGYTLLLHCENCGEPLKREWKVCPACQMQTPEK